MVDEIEDAPMKTVTEVPVTVTEVPVPATEVPVTAPETEEAKRARAPRAKQGKLIVRNLGFDLKEKHMKAVFRKFGPILEINIPVNPTSNLNRGFGFVEFEKREDAASAITALQGTKYKGRNLTVEFSVPKETYERRLDSIVEHTNMERKDAVVPMSV